MILISHLLSYDLFGIVPKLRMGDSVLFVAAPFIGGEFTPGHHMNIVESCSELAIV